MRGAFWKSIAVAGAVLAAPPAQAELPTLPAGEAGLQELLDREEIRLLLLEYGRAFDERRLEDYAALFAENGEWVGGPTVAKGPAEVLAMVTRVVADLPTGPGKRNFHVMTNMMIDVEGDSATAWSRYTFYMPGAGGPEPVVSGVYDDRLIRVDGHWKFLRRQLTADVAVGRQQEEAGH